MRVYTAEYRKGRYQIRRRDVHCRQGSPVFGMAIALGHVGGARSEKHVRGFDHEKPAALLQTHEASVFPPACFPAGLIPGAN